MQKSLIIFDLDGTLIDSVPDLSKAVSVMLAGLGVAFDDVDLVRSWVGNGSKVLVARALSWAKLPSDDKALHHAHELFLQSYQACVCDKTVEYDGVTAGLDKLKARGLTLAIATNKPKQFVPDILAKMGWSDKFACVLGGDSLSAKKPDPLPLLHICQRLGVDTAGAVMVGDSKNDIQAGQNANITTLALTYGYNYDEPIANSCPDAVFDEFGALVDFVLREFSGS